jgi:hypothetical protein
MRSGVMALSGRQSCPILRLHPAEKRENHSDPHGSLQTLAYFFPSASPTDSVELLAAPLALTWFRYATLNLRMESHCW